MKKMFYDKQQIKLEHYCTAPNGICPYTQDKHECITGIETENQICQYLLSKRIIIPQKLPHNNIEGHLKRAIHGLKIQESWCQYNSPQAKQNRAIIKTLEVILKLRELPLSALTEKTTI